MSKDSRTSERQAADEAEIEAMSRENDHISIIANRNFDPTEMDDIQVIRIDTDEDHRKFKELLGQDYLCYGLHKVRQSAGTYNYSEHFHAVIAKKRE